jgi:hypothetical protein
MSEATIKTWDAVVRIVMPLLTLGVVGLVTTTLSVDKRLTVVEASRYTTANGVVETKDRRDYEIGIEAKLHRILILIEQVRSAIPPEVPPAWFLKQVQTLEDRVEKLENEKK